MYSLDEVIIIVSIAVAIVAFLAYQLGQFVLIARMLGTLDEAGLERLDALTKKLEEAMDDESNTKRLIQEVMSGVVFLYDDKNNFVAQGNSAAEAAANFFKSKHSTSLAIVECSEGKTYQIIDGKIQPNDKD